jgi:SAM-dependent methyltransferase
MKDKPACPHCGITMECMKTPYESTWGGEIHFVCFNDECSYYLNSWSALEEQGIENAGYRCRMDPRGQCGPIAVWSDSALRNLIVQKEDKLSKKHTHDFFNPEDFSREDETSDTEYYQHSKHFDNLDSLALSTIDDLFVRLIPKGAEILDLMAGADSHISSELQPARITGVGLDSKELEANVNLSEKIIHDLNSEKPLPFKDDEFDVALVTLSIEYIIKPLEFFQEVARILSPKGLFIITFSNRMFPPKAVNIWKYSSEQERVALVKKLISLSNSFTIVGDFESSGKPRPKEDKYYMLGIPSDPIYAIWARPNN